VIVEVLPAGDILDYHFAAPTLFGSLPYPILITLTDRMGLRNHNQSAQASVFPLGLSLPGQTYLFADFIPYLSTLTIDNTAIESSKNWMEYVNDLAGLVEDARNQNACVMLLYIPSKAEIYLPLAQSPHEIEPVLDYVQTYQLDQDDRLVRDRASKAQASVLQANAKHRPGLVEDLAEQLNLSWINPAPALAQAASSGLSPYMTYDTHWSLFGHQIIADEVARAIRLNPCP
jgi:hypothetical protein